MQARGRKNNYPEYQCDSHQRVSKDFNYTKNLRLEPGKSYRLCIGAQNPEAVQMGSSNYRCLVDYEFIFKAK